MTTIALEVDSTLREIERFAGLLRTVNEPSRPVAGVGWTVAEVGAHVLSGITEYRLLLEGGGPLATVEEIPTNNQRLLTIYRERDPQILADRILTAAKALGAAAGRLAPTDELAWYGDLRLPAAAVLGVLANESMLHGRDVARMLDRRWPIERSAAIRGTLALTHIMHIFVDEKASAGFTGSYRVALRGGPSIDYVFREGRLTTTVDARGRVDCHISADPVTFLLAGYQRIGPARAAASGGMVALGRKPWLALRFSRLFRPA